MWKQRQKVSIMVVVRYLSAQNAKRAMHARARSDTQRHAAAHAMVATTATYNTKVNVLNHHAAFSFHAAHA